MGRWWVSLPGLAALLTVIGCYTSNHVKIKPPKHEEEYTLPPANETRFDEPLKYPKETLNQDSIKKTKDGPQQPPPTMRGGGAGGPRFNGGPGSPAGY